jgi:hypothetical protein
MLEGILDSAEDDGIKAEASYELFSLAKEQAFREQALSLYRALNERTPNYEFEKKINILCSNSEEVV